MTPDLCAGPFCDLDHAHRAFLYDQEPRPELSEAELALLGWEGPMGPVFREDDPEAWDEVFGGRR